MSRLGSMDWRLASLSSSMVPVKEAKETDAGVEAGLIRMRNERKSIASITRHQTGPDTSGSAPKKSRSASDLLSVKVRASAPVWPGQSAGDNSGRTDLGLATASRKQSTPVKMSDHQMKQRHVRVIDGASSSLDPNGSVNAQSPFAEMDSLRKLAHRERRFRRLFRSVPTTESLLCRYSCAYVSDIGLLLQGHLYMSTNWICFHSNIFGIEKIIEIPAESVISVSKSHTAKIIPNAVKIKTEGRYYLFGSLLSRDNTFRQLVSVTANGIRRGSTSSAAKHDFLDDCALGKSKMDHGDDTDDESSLSSSLTSDTTSSNAVDERKATATTADATGRTSGHVWRRFFQSKEDRQRANSAVGHGKRRGNSFAKDAAARWLLPHLFFGLPKTLMILIVCVVLITFLFLCATVLTIRLMYIRKPTSLWEQITPWDSESYAEVLLSRQSLENMDALLERTLQMLSETKQYLGSLKQEVETGLAESAAFTLSTSHLGGTGEEQV